MEPELKIKAFDSSSPTGRVTIKPNVMETDTQSGLLLFVVKAQRGNMNLLAGT